MELSLESVKNLSCIEGAIPTYYSLGYEKRALEIRGFLDQMMGYYKNELGVNIDIKLVLLNKPDHQKRMNFIYGMPFITTESETWIVSMPASQEGVISEMFVQLEGSIVPDLKKRFSDEKLDYRESVHHHVDTIGFHEVGHAFCYSAGLENLVFWLSEFMATYFSYNFMMEQDKLSALIWDLFAEINVGNVEVYSFQTLRAFEENYEFIAEAHPQNYVWYQSQFSKQVREIHQKYGITFIREFIRIFENKNYDLEESNRRISQAFPEFKNWILHFS